MYKLEVFNKKTGNIIGFTSDDGKVFVKKGIEFKIRFNNSTNKRIQARLSIDGTDVLTGDVAGTEVTGKMFLIEPYDYLELEAWPETDESGRQFMFSEAEDGVSKNTHGDTSGLGYIAVAVFTEKELPKYRPYFNRPILNSRRSKRFTKSSGPISGSNNYGATFNSKQEDKSVSVGAGDKVIQKIAKATGLKNPVFDTIVQLKYELQKVSKAFPKDKKPEVLNSNLKSVPNPNHWEKCI